MVTSRWLKPLSARSPYMTGSGNEPYRCEHPHRSRLFHVDDDSFSGTAVKDEADQAVVARVGVLHYALVTADDKRARLCSFAVRRVRAVRGIFVPRLHLLFHQIPLLLRTVCHVDHVDMRVCHL